MNTYPRPTHAPQNESQRLIAAADRLERNFSATVDTDRKLAYQYLAAGALLRELAAQIEFREWREEIEAQEADAADLRATQNDARF